jgi:transcriptional regulator with XRE-family HTH domain
MGAQRTDLPERVRDRAEELGRNLAVTRRLHRLTAAELAELAGVSRDSVSRLERGDAGVSLAVALKVADALGTLLRVDDPLSTPHGRELAASSIPKRVRHPAAVPRPDVQSPQ